VNIASQSALTALIRDDGASNPDSRAGQIYSYLHPQQTGGGGGEAAAADRPRRDTERLVRFRGPVPGISA